MLGDTFNIAVVRNQLVRRRQVNSIDMGMPIWKLLDQMKTQDGE